MKNKGIRFTTHIAPEISTFNIVQLAFQTFLF
jgi:hypothetical protein